MVCQLVSLKIVRFLKEIDLYYLVVTFLLILYFLGTLTFGIEKVLAQALPSVLTTFVIGGLFYLFWQKKWQFPWTFLISGLIIGLVSQFGEEAFKLLAIAVAAMIIKLVVRIDNQPLFNPAASGLLLGQLFFSSHPSWWGTQTFWIFLLWIPILLYKLKRWTPIVGFLLPLVAVNGLGILTSSPLLFFLSVMLIEPMTSPVLAKTGLIYGLVVAIVYLIFTQTTVLLDPLISSLLIGNLTYRLMIRFGI